MEIDWFSHVFGRILLCGKMTANNHVLDKCILILFNGPREHVYALGNESNFFANQDIGDEYAKNIGFGFVESNRLKIYKKKPFNIRVSRIIFTDSKEGFVSNCQRITFTFREKML